MKFRYIDFSQDISQKAALENCSCSCLCITPNHRSLQELRLAFQIHMQLKKYEFYTMEEYKQLLILNKKPLLKEERRTLAFYASLSAEHKEFFHINSYFQSIKLAHNFFAFFEELAEENINFCRITDVLEKSETDNQWQKETFEILLRIRHEYKTYITERGFDDKIFCQLDEKLQNSYHKNFERFLVLNQFYFTQCEKNLLPDNAVIYLQFPPELYNEEELQGSNSFSADHLGRIRTRQILHKVFKDGFSLKHELFSTNFSSAKDLLVDTGLLREHISEYLPAFNKTRSFSSSSIYNFFAGIHLLLQGIELHENALLLGINELLSVSSDEHFLSCFSPPENTDCHEKLTTWLYKLVDYDYKYIDFDLKLVDKKPQPETAKLLQNLFKCLLNFRNIETLTEFTKVINNFPLPEIMLSTECRSSDLAEIYFQLQHDFAALSKIEVVKSWNRIFPQDKRRFAFAESMLRLFLEYSRAKNFRYFSTRSNIIQPEITTLNNTRNLLCENVYIVDAIEGRLPSTRQTPFLLTEQQRRKLKLKTYSDIIQREKYYFLRLIAQSSSVTIFSREQEKEGIEVSSFVEEIKLLMPLIFKQNNDNISFSIKDFYKLWLPASSPQLPPPQLPEDFFVLPFNKENDLRDNIFPLSPSSTNLLIKQPFLYYLSNMLKLQERQVTVEMEYSTKQLGSIIHAVFAEIWQRLQETYQGNKVHHDFRFNQKNYAERAFDHYYMKNQNLILKNPYNQAQLYFSKILRTFIIDALEVFLRQCADLYNNQMMRILPESNDQFLQRKKLFFIDDIELTAFGKADLRLEFLGKNEKHIYDYKSGSYKKYSIADYAAQLTIYEKLYYPADAEVKKFIYFVIDQEVKEITTKADGLLQNLKDTLKKIVKEGYFLGETKAAYEPEDLVRRKLGIQLRKENEEE